MNEMQRFMESAGLRFEDNGKLTSDGNQGNPPEMEDFIMLSEQEKTYYVYEVHRADRILIKAEQDKDRAVIWAVILYKRMTDDTADRTAARKIRSFIGEGDKTAARELFHEFDSGIFSIGEEKEDHLCLIQNNGQADVTYNGKKIVGEVSPARGYVVLYNYCRNLREILRFYQKNRELMEEKGIGEREAAELYMGI